MTRLTRRTRASRVSLTTPSAGPSQGVVLASLLLEVLVHPGDETIEGIQAVRPLTETVALARIDDVLDGHLLQDERLVELVALPWPDPLLNQRLRTLVDLFRNRILDSSGAHFHHFFDELWNPRSDSYTYGHDIEGSWLLCEAAETLEDSSLLADTRATALRIARAVLDEGVDSDGGLFYEGRNGSAVRTVKEWWPQAEAVVGFLNAWQLTGEGSFLEAAAHCCRFIQEEIIDHLHGEWYCAVSREGTTDASLPKVSMWKCPYHNSRACLEIINRTGPAQPPNP